MDRIITYLLGIDVVGSKRLFLKINTHENRKEKFMEEFESNVTGLCSTLQPYGYVLAIVAALVLGAMFAFPSDESHKAAKKIAPWVIIGVILFIGATSLGTWLADQITFTGGTGGK